MKYHATIKLVVNELDDDEAALTLDYIKTNIEKGSFTNLRKFKGTIKRKSKGYGIRLPDVIVGKLKWKND